MKISKHVDLIHAWANGLPIEGQVTDGVWLDLGGPGEPHQPGWFEGSEYRIQPPKPVTVVASITDGILTTESGETINLMKIQYTLAMAFGDLGHDELSEGANELAKLTLQWVDEHGSWQDLGGQTEMTTELQPFTVLLLRPDSYADDTFMDHVMAYAPEMAQDIARSNAAHADLDPEDKDEMSSDDLHDFAQSYAVILTIKGHHYDCSTER